MKVTKDIRYIGVNDHKIDLFEGQYDVPLGMAYNSYVIMDNSIAVMDTVDARFGNDWIKNLKGELNGRTPSYLIVQHMEPDHSSNIVRFTEEFPDAVIVANKKCFTFMDQFYHLNPSVKRLVVNNGDTLELGTHTLKFVFAPMVHWPEVMVTYETTDKVLFTADGFGKFGANDVEDPKGWDSEARRYYIGIVGKYGPQVQTLLKVAATLDIRVICPLHGPVLSDDLGHYLKLYDTWSSYSPESDGIMIAYTSVYGHTRAAVELLADKLKAKGCPRVIVADLAREDMSECVANAFRFGKLICATTTYNGDIFPFMRTFIEHLTERSFQNRTVGFIENGTWGPTAKRVMTGMLEGSKNITFAENNVTIRSSLTDANVDELEALAVEMTKDYTANDDTLADKEDMKALFRIGYGLYVITSRDGEKDNGCICNTVIQLTDNPNRVAVNINKNNLTYDIVKKTGKMNVNCLSTDTPFSVFEHFGFQSGRAVNKFADENVLRSGNGISFMPHYINALLSLEVESYVDLDTHGMFICRVTEARVMSDKETMTYTYYQSNVKPKPETAGKKGWVCKVCGYIYEDDELPADFVCPLCKHGSADFEPIQ